MSGRKHKESPRAPDTRITREQIERKLDQINASVDAGAETVVGVGKAAGAATFVGAVTAAYLLGRRRARRRRTIVEVRRI